jgi:hypothetical protein
MSEFIEKYPHEAGFAAHYAREIAPYLSAAEEERLRTLSHFTTRLVLSLTAILITGYFALVNPIFEKENQNIDAAIKFLFLFTVARSAFILHKIYKSYSVDNKKLLLPALVSFFPQTIVEIENYITPEEVAHFKILPHYNIYRGEDKITQIGMFTACELHLFTDGGPRKRNQEVRVFNGLAVLFDLPRAVSAPIAVLPRVNLVSTVLAQTAQTHGKKIILEDPVFNQLFEVYSQDQIEGRRVLQPALMLRLMQLSILMQNWGQDPAKLPEGSRPGEIPSYLQAAKAKPRCAIAMGSNQLFITIPCARNMFETGSLFKSAYNSNEIRCTLYQIYLLLLINKELRQFPQMVS